MFHPDRPNNLFTCSINGELWHWNNVHGSKLNLGNIISSFFFTYMKKNIIIIINLYKF